MKKKNIKVLFATYVVLITPLSATRANDIDVLTVFASGSGSNYVKKGIIPAGMDSQVTMYDQLPDALDNLDFESLRNYVKPADFDVNPNEIAEVTHPKPGVRIVRDSTHHIPHVYGETRRDAMFGVGYVRAVDRLWQMESFRAVWRAESATMLGRGENNSNVISDALTFRLIDYSEAEYQIMYNRLSTNYGRWGIQAANDIKAYIDGMNAYIDSIKRVPIRLPIEYTSRGLKPQPWKVTDAMAMAAYSHVAWGSAGPGEEMNAQLYRQLQDRFGANAQAIYNDLRNAPDAATQYSLPKVSGWVSDVNPASIAMIDLDSFVPREIVNIDSHSTAAHTAKPLLNNMRSNALLVAARHSVTGKPIGVQGPQDGYGTPHLFDSEIVIVAPDFKARGILELSGPYPYVASRGAGYAWSITILSPDQSDTFAEVLCEPDGSSPTINSMFYQYKGECLPINVRVDRKTLPDGNYYTLRSERSVHGPLIGRATVDGRPVALAQARTMYLHEEMDYPAHAKLFSPSVIHSASDFIETVAGTAYNIGWWYIDNENIAGVDAGLSPIRKAGASMDLPIWGTGDWDWIGFDAETYTFLKPQKSQYPQTVNGAAGILTGWNNPSAEGFTLKDETWNFSALDRVQLLKEPTITATDKGKISIVDLVKIHTEAAITDFHAQRVYPIIRQFIGSVENTELERLLKIADEWSITGGFLRDINRDGYLEHGPSVVLLEEYWTQIVNDAFRPLLGDVIFDGAGTFNNLPTTHPSPDNANAWIVKILAGVQHYLGKEIDDFSMNYCGKTAELCRDFLVLSFATAIKKIKLAQGNDITMWKVAATCDFGCRQINFFSTGNMDAIPSISWQNRGTYIQVTTGH
jgi:acyl-homoserine lactone acylase PvdQ